jgi:hypothetical protein
MSLHVMTTSVLPLYPPSVPIREPPSERKRKNEEDESESRENTMQGLKRILDEREQARKKETQKRITVTYRAQHHESLTVSGEPFDLKLTSKQVFTIGMEQFCHKTLEQVRCIQ